MEKNDWQKTTTILDAAKAQIEEKAGEFYHSYNAMLRVSYSELKRHGILEAWLVSRGKTETSGDYDLITIGQAVALGLIKTRPAL